MKTLVVFVETTVAGIIVLVAAHLFGIETSRSFYTGVAVGAAIGFAVRMFAERYEHR